MPSNPPSCSRQTSPDNRLLNEWEVLSSLPTTTVDKTRKTVGDRGDKFQAVTIYGEEASRRHIERRTKDVRENR